MRRYRVVVFMLEFRRLPLVMSAVSQVRDSVRPMRPCAHCAHIVPNTIYANTTLRLGSLVSGTASQHM